MTPAKRNILLIDDDPAIRQFLLHILEEENYFVRAVANGVEVFALVETTKFDLVLLDLNTPIKDGWETFEQLSSRNPLLPIILITAYPNQFSSALASGARALLEKPLDFVQLFYTIRHLLEEPAEVRLASFAGRYSTFPPITPKTDNPRREMN
jgi:CheY-like chemotaxis protein